MDVRLREIRLDAQGLPVDVQGGIQLAQFGQHMSQGVQSEDVINRCRSLTLNW